MYKLVFASLPSPKKERFAGSILDTFSIFSIALSKFSDKFLLALILSVSSLTHLVTVRIPFLNFSKETDT